MRTSIRRWAPALGALVFAWAIIPSALAQCGMPTKHAKPAAWDPQMGGAHVTRTAMAGDEEERSPPKPATGKIFPTQSSTMPWQFGMPTKRKS